MENTSYNQIIYDILASADSNPLVDHARDHLAAVIDKFFGVEPFDKEALFCHLEELAASLDIPIPSYEKMINLTESK